MSDLMVRGPVSGGQANPSPYTAGITGGQRVHDVHGRFLQALLENRLYYMSVAAGAPTAYVGAAGGTPLIAAHNPLNSNKYASLLLVGYAARGQVTAAGTTALAVWSGVSAQPTGTQTPPRSALSLQTSGSAMLGFSNTALTGSTALNLALPLNAFHLIGATPVSESNMNSMYDVGGIVTIAPGNQFAIGVTTVPTGLTCDIGVWWEELPFLVQA